MNNTKTLKGIDNWLFLTNDVSRSLDKHMHNACIPSTNLIQKKANNHKLYIIVIPDKEVICKDYLPNNIKINYRTAVDIYKSFFKERLLDPTSILDATDYYKTDTHINNKGNLKIWNLFRRSIGLHENHINIENIETDSLSTIGKAIGDLTWTQNKQNVVLDDTNDMYYKLPTRFEFYMTTYNEEENFKVLDYDLNLVSHEYIDWHVVSNSIFYNETKTADINKKVIFFYDSMILSAIRLYQNIFREIYCIKNVFRQDLVNKINPDLIFEFRVERFLGI